MCVKKRFELLHIGLVWMIRPLSRFCSRLSGFDMRLCRLVVGRYAYKPAHKGPPVPTTFSGGALDVILFTCD